jgi:hypothetical protein
LHIHHSEETVMKSRKVKSVVSLAALIAASVSVASHADTNPALDLCVQKFVAEVVPADHTSEVRHADIVASIKPITASQSKVMLIAKGESDAKLFGQASCVIDRNGMLVAMYLYDAKLRQPTYGRSRVLARNVDATQGARTAFADGTKPF